MQRYRNVSTETKRENNVLPELSMPNRIVSYAKVQKGECNVKIKNNVFSVFDKNGAREYAMRKIEFLSPVRRIRTNVKQNQQKQAQHEW